MILRSTTKTRNLAARAIALLLVAGATRAQVERDERLSYGEPAAAGVDAERLRAAAQLYAQAVKSDDLRGVVLLVARRGRIVLHEAYGWRDLQRRKPMRKDSLFRMASNTKAVTAAGILALVDEGKLRLDDPVCEHLPGFDNPRSRAITVRQLLTHTSGFRIPTLFLRPLLQRSAEHPDAPSLQLEVARIGAAGPKVEPGTTYEYSNPGYNVLAGLIEVASGKPYASYLRERIYRPLGLKDTWNHESVAPHSRMSAVFRSRKEGRWTLGWKPGDPPDYPFPRGSGGMISTAYDFAVFCQMLLNGGSYGGKKVLSAALVAEAVNPQAAHIPAAKSYGLGWVVAEPGGIYSHGGSDGTWAWVDPQREVIGLVLTQSPGGKKRNPRKRFQGMVATACVD